MIIKSRLFFLIYKNKPLCVDSYIYNTGESSDLCCDLYEDREDGESGGVVWSTVDYDQAVKVAKGFGDGGSADSPTNKFLSGDMIKNKIDIMGVSLSFENELEYSKPSIEVL